MIIERPLLTEKSTDQAGDEQVSISASRLDANKIEIAHAIEAIYAEQGVQVLAVNTLHVKGKKKRAMARGGKAGYSPNWKKAIVTTDKPLVAVRGDLIPCRYENSNLPAPGDASASISTFSELTRKSRRHKEPAGRSA